MIELHEKIAHHQLLYLSAGPDGWAEAQGLTSEEQWFADALGISLSKISVVNIMRDGLPTTVEQHGVIIGGSPHSTYEDLPWMQQLKNFIHVMYQQNKPLLGICFGHQIVADAFDGLVTMGDKGREFGAVEIELTPNEGFGDGLFTGLAKRFSIGTSHKDVVKKAPHLARPLAHNETYANQALAIGDSIRTIQPHPEDTCEITMTLARAREEILIEEGLMEPNGLPSFEQRLRLARFEPNGQKILQNFVNNFVITPPNS